MDRRSFISRAGCAVVNTLLFGGMTAEAASEKKKRKDKPNVVFILTDDLGWGDLGCYGHPYIKTPNIDRLAREGTSFNQFYVNSTVCAPSRVGFTTGQYPVMHDVHTIYYNADYNEKHGVPDYLNSETFTFGDLMKRAGYATAHIGKWHLGGRMKSPEPPEYGYEFSRPGDGGHRNYWQDWRPDNYLEWFNDSTKDFVNEAIKFVDKNKDGPFFLQLWTHMPHAYLKPGKEAKKEYEGLKADPNDFDSWMTEYLEDAENLQDQMKTYCASVTKMDKRLGKLFAHIDKLGLKDDTIIFFTSDNGPEDYHVGNAANAGVGSTGVFRGRKRSIYEGGIRMPAIIRWPGKTPAGKVNNSVWSGVDLLPTLASVTKTKLPIAYRPDGEDVSEAWLGNQRDHRKPIFWEWKFEVVGNPSFKPPQLAVRKGKWKLLCDPDGTKVELYDLNTDPQERKNVFGKYPEISEKLKTILLTWKLIIPE